MKKIFLAILSITLIYLIYILTITVNAKNRCLTLKIGDDLSKVNFLFGSAYGKMPENDQIIYLYNPTEAYNLIFTGGVMVITDKNNKLIRIDCE